MHCFYQCVANEGGTAKSNFSSLLWYLFLNPCCFAWETKCGLGRNVDPLLYKGRRGTDKKVKMAAASMQLKSCSLLMCVSHAIHHLNFFDLPHRCPYPFPGIFAYIAKPTKVANINKQMQSVFLFNLYSPCTQRCRYLIEDLAYDCCRGKRIRLNRTNYYRSSWSNRTVRCQLLEKLILNFCFLLTPQCNHKSLVSPYSCMWCHFKWVIV